MKKVLLIGIGGVYNYGCEAIVRGTTAILKKYDPLIQIHYASYNYKNDKKRLTNCDIIIVNRDRNKTFIFLKRILRKFLSRIHITYSIPYDSFGWISKMSIDTVFSIGGDIYTLTANGKYNNNLPMFLENCATHNIRYILWGASIGPFIKNEEAFNYYREHLKKINLIVVREKNTMQYLKNMGITYKVILAPDPAFFVQTSVSENNNSKQNLLGINMSPLSAIYEYGTLEKGLDVQRKAIIHILLKTEYNIMLIPHVFSKNHLDNDLWYMMQLFETIPENYKDRISVFKEDVGFLGIKRELCQCKLVIAARMHCAINAIEANVPVLFLSYSEKSKGMANFVYNSTNAVMKLSEFCDDDALIDRINNWDEKSTIENIKKYDFSSILNFES